MYIAYREMKRLEARIFERMNELSKRGDTGQKVIGFVTASQFYGIDINPFAVELAKVTMMIARKLAIDELHVNERALPLDNLDGNFTPADVIIGNPPFLDARKMTAPGVPQAILIPTGSPARTACGSIRNNHVEPRLTHA